MNYMRQSNTFQLEEDPSSKGVQGITFIMLEASIIMNFLQTKPQPKCFTKIPMTCIILSFSIHQMEEKNQVSDV